MFLFEQVIPRKFFLSIFHFNEIDNSGKRGKLVSVAQWWISVAIARNYILKFWKGEKGAITLIFRLSKFILFWPLNWLNPK